MTQGFQMIDAALFAVLLLLMGLAFAIVIDPYIRRECTLEVHNSQGMDD